MIKSFSGQVVFCFAILRAISAYVGENWLSQYTLTFTFSTRESLVRLTIYLKGFLVVLRLNLVRPF